VPRLRNEQGNPNFGVKFYALRKDGEFGGAQMRGTGQMIVSGTPTGCVWWTSPASSTKTSRPRSRRVEPPTRSTWRW